jgi:hypothetical protein
LPEQDAVIAITANTRDMQGQLNLVWNNLLPAFKPTPLPDDSAEQFKLKETISFLAVPKDHVELVLKLPGTSKADPAPQAPR